MLRSAQHDKRRAQNDNVRQFFIRLLNREAKVAHSFLIALHGTIGPAGKLLARIEFDNHPALEPDFTEGGKDRRKIHRPRPNFTEVTSLPADEIGVLPSQFPDIFPHVFEMTKD